jgi:hypothetical protein
MDHDGNETHALFRTALEEMGDLGVADETRGEEVARDQEDRDMGRIHCSADLGFPGVSGTDAAVVPYIDQSFLSEDREVAGETILPSLIHVAIAKEDPERRHERNFSRGRGIGFDPRSYAAALHGRAGGARQEEQERYLAEY